MKTLLIFSILLMAGVAAAQASRNPSEPPDLVTLDRGWYVRVFYPDRDPNPLRLNEDYQRLVIAHKESTRRNEARNGGTTIESVGVPASSPVPERLDRYVYEAKVKNTGLKSIRAISWDYVFIDPDTGEEMGHHKTTSRVRIKPGKDGKLRSGFVAKPTFVVNIARLGKKLKSQFTEHVIIDRIDYTDGSVWKRPPGKDEK